MRLWSPAAVWTLTVAVSVAACSNSTEKFPPACPSLAVLRDAADLTRYAAADRDLSDLALDARITAVPAKCERGEPGKVKATLSVAVEVTRGPAATGRRADVPYFVGVTEGTRVLDEQDYTIGVTFPPNVDRIRATGSDVVLKLPVSREKSAAAYSIYVGFRLSPEELALNRQRGPR